jgi:outer membrane protein assembly factor BamE
MHKLLKLLVALLFVSSAFLTGCGAKVPIIKPFKMDIQQGNVVTSKMLLQLKPGMTKSQVKFIMGTPLVVDSFHTNRWDYFYQMRQAGKIKEQRRVILEFEKDLLLRVRGDVVPEGTVGAAAGSETSTARTITVEPKPKEETSWTDKLKFWKKDEKKPEVKSETAKPEPKVAAPILEDKSKINLKTPTNDAPGANNDEPAGDAPSVLAVPIQLGPLPEAPAVEMPKVELPKLESAKAESQKTAPIRPAASSAPATKQDEPFIFRMDKNLDTKNLEMPPVEAASAVKPKVEAPPPAPLEEEPGYFEKMLEKIGF